MKLVECVPNFSEGRDRTVLDAIAKAVESVDGVRLLDVDPGAATNRTVFTFVGPPEAIEEAAVRAIGKASELIDMRRHHGTHPRMGATDVCPFVPLGETTMEECVELARRVGARIGKQFDLPVYLYERAATSDARRSLADIRKGEYEGLEAKLEAKLADPAWSPDFGPAIHNPRLGATAVGAREFLIAYNVNLNTRDRRLANTVAQNIRETGRPRRDAAGRIVKDGRGRTVTEPGASQLPAIRATGWYIEEYGRAQVSMNLMDFRVSSLHAAFEAACVEAGKLGVRVTGSEIVGLVPLEAILDAGRHYLAEQGKSGAVPDPELIRTAVVSLGLEEVSGFEPSRKIIEYRVMEANPLGSTALHRFCDSVAGPTPTPGGGSVAALMGALSGGLTAMVAAISYERKGYEGRREELLRLGREAHRIRARLVQAVDEDARAFDRVLRAHRMRRGSDEERRARDDAVQAATRGAIDVPLAIMRDGLRALELAGEIAAAGVKTALSDAGVASQAAAAAVEGAAYNVMINLEGLADRHQAERLRTMAKQLRERAVGLARANRENLERMLGPSQSSPAK